MKYNEKGEEIPDPTPVRTTPRVRITPNKLQEFQAMLRTASYLAKSEGFETLEESEDFDMDDSDFDPQSPWEMQFDPIAGKEITRQEMEFLNKQREEFTQRFGKETPWWRRMLHKKRKETPPAAPEKDLKKPSPDESGEE